MIQFVSELLNSLELRKIILKDTINIVQNSMVQNEKKFKMLNKAILDESLDRLKLNLGLTLFIQEKILQKPIEVLSVFEESETFFSDCESLRITLMKLIKLIKKRKRLAAIIELQEVAQLKKSLVSNRRTFRKYLGRPVIECPVVDLGESLRIEPDADDYRYFVDYFDSFFKSFR